MADGHHFTALTRNISATVYGNGRQEIWRDDDSDPMNFTLLDHTLCLLFYVINPQTL